jgi:arabinosyltransferase C
VLLSWQQSFVFPCVHEVAQVADGLAQTPRVVITTGGSWFTEPEDQHLAGVFAGLQPFGQLYQVPTRLARHPDVQWGALLLSGASAVDAYAMRRNDVRRPGHADRHRLYQVDLPP